MICAQCRQAGKLNAQANEINAEPGTIALHRMARSVHSTCTDKKNCTCQHIVGKVLK